MIHPTTRVLSAQLPEHVGETVEISGWLHRRRALKTVTFLVLRDRSGLAQVVLGRGVGVLGRIIREQLLTRFGDEKARGVAHLALLRGWLLQRGAIGWGGDAVRHRGPDVRRARAVPELP